MMINRKIKIISPLSIMTALLFLVLGNTALADNFKPFTTESFAAIKEQYAGKPFFVSLWTCWVNW